MNEDTLDLEPGADPELYIDNWSTVPSAPTVEE